MDIIAQPNVGCKLSAISGCTLDLGRAFQAVEKHYNKAVTFEVVIQPTDPVEGELLASTGSANGGA